MVLCSSYISTYCSVEPDARGSEQSLWLLRRLPQLPQDERALVSAYLQAERSSSQLSTEVGADRGGKAMLRPRYSHAEMKQGEKISTKLK